MRQFKNIKNITERSNISVNKYLKEVSRYPMVTVDEEVILAQKIRQGGKEADKARQRLVEANLRFVISVANQYHQHNMDLSDLRETLGLSRQQSESSLRWRVREIRRNPEGTFLFRLKV